jgi:Mrp family chromosome partitioning ATPase
VADRVRSASELERAGPPVVAALRLPSNLPAAGDEDRGFAFLAGRLSSMTGERRSGVRILVTSPRRQSGTSRVAVNTAAGLAGLGRHVVLIDADVSSWGSSSMIADSPRPGFAEVLCGSASAEEALRPTGLPDVHLLPAAPSGSPAPLNVDNLKLMLGQLAARNVVVVDGPALLTSPETLVLAGHVDIILLVADLRTLRRREAAAALRLLEGAADGATIAWVTHTPGVGRDGREPSVRRPSLDDESGLDDADAGRPIDVSRPPRS